MSSAEVQLSPPVTFRMWFLVFTLFLSDCCLKSDSQIAAQIDVMNQAYAGAGISWFLAATTRTVNSDWFNNSAPDTTQQTAMKSALRAGGPETLNVYTVGYVICSIREYRLCFSYTLSSFTSGPGAGLLGYSTFPSDYASHPTDDGVVILFSSLPGGTTVPYNLGQVKIGSLLSSDQLTSIPDPHTRSWPLGWSLSYLPRWLFWW